MIGKNSHDYRPLGLGYANLGALLMAAGLPYDSDAGRDYAACVTAIMCGEAYLQSSQNRRTLPAAGSRNRANQERSADTNLGVTADVRRQPPDYARRSLPRLVHQPRAVPRRHPHAPRVGQQHQQAPTFPLRSTKPARTCWDEALTHGEKHGYRNAQVTVLAPTGTIGFMMDCDTTGIEPDLALVKYKKLVGGGMIKIVNNTVPTRALQAGLHARADRRHRQLHRRHRHHRRRAAVKDEHLAGLRLLVQAGQGHALHSLHGTPAHDGGGAAVHLRRDLEDRQPAGERDGRRHHAKPTSRPGSWA